MVLLRWDTTNGCKSDPNALIFSLTNGDNQQLKMKVNPRRHEYAIGCDSSCGPSFGGGGDICIANNAKTTMDSYSNLGHTYSHHQYEEDTFLTGSYKFQLDEIEVY